MICKSHICNLLIFHLVITIIYHTNRLINNRCSCTLIDKYFYIHLLDVSTDKYNSFYFGLLYPK
jgi:hypothetical protein